MSDFKCDQMDKCQGDCGPWCTGYNKANKELSIQKLDEVKAEIGNINQLTAQGMIKIVEVLKYLVEVS